MTHFIHYLLNDLVLTTVYSQKLTENSSLRSLSILYSMFMRGDSQTIRQMNKGQTTYIMHHNIELDLIIE